MTKLLIGALALGLLSGQVAHAQEGSPAHGTAQPEAPQFDAANGAEDRLAALEEMLNRPATPYVVGAVRLDVSRLVVATGQLRRGQAIFNGTVQHAQIGRLTAELNLRDALQNDNVPIGTPMYLVEFVSRAGGARAVESAPWRVTAVWCGNLGRKTIFGTPSPSLCLFDRDPRVPLLVGDRAFISMQSRPWITTSGTAMNASLAANNFQIERVTDQPFGPMDVRLEVSRFGARDVRLTLFATLAGDDVVLMRFVVPITDGRAVLPFWDHRLQLAVDRNGVTPTLTMDGDGSSPIPFGTYPA